MTLTDNYVATTRRTESVLTDALESWKDGLDFVTAQFRAFPTAGNFPQIDATEAVERQFEFIKKVTDINHGYARQLAEAANTVSGAVRQHIEGLNTAILDQVQSLSEVTRSNVDNFEQSVRETADQAERVQREAQEQAEKVERDRRRQAKNAAREHYRSLNKNDLADEAAKRNLPKTGTVDELVERLVANDTE